jgi:polar amino acid transport system substrate-binding protein
MKKAFKVFALCALVIGLFALTGCGAPKAAEQPAPAPTTPEAAAPAPAPELVTYKVGTDAAYAPFESVDPTGKCVGFDMDVVSAIAEAGGFKVEFINTAWDGIIASLEANKNDIVVSAMTITDERKKAIDFSEPYFQSTNYILVPENSTVKSIADLKGKTVSVQQGTTGDVAITEQLGKDYTGIKRFKGTPEAFLELKNGAADAAVADSGVVAEFVKSNPDMKLKVILDEKFPKESYGIAVKKGNAELLAKINTGLKTIQDNGKYAEIYKSYGFK